MNWLRRMHADNQALLDLCAEAVAAGDRESAIALIVAEMDVRPWQANRILQEWGLLSSAGREALAAHEKK